MSVRIAKFIADSGIASRRAAEDMIANGRVAVNGNVINTPVFFVEDDDKVTVDGVHINVQQNTKLYAFHKPINVMTTRRDPEGRRTIYDCLDDKYKNLKYVGRLDYKTTGLLLLTNDGDLARRLTLPSSHIPREYMAKVLKVDEQGINRARSGVTVDGIVYRPMVIDVMKDNVLRVRVTEGKKNEVRIVLRACGCPVIKLQRVSFGPIKLGNLSVGEMREIEQKTVDALLKTL